MNNLDLFVAAATGILGGAGTQRLFASFANRQNAHSNVLNERADAQDAVNKSHQTMLTQLQETTKDLQGEMRIMRKENKKLVNENYQMKMQLIRMAYTIKELRRDLDERDRVIAHLNTQIPNQPPFESRRKAA